MVGGSRCDVLPNHVDARDDDSERTHGNLIHIPWSDSRDTVHVHDSFKQRIRSERNCDDVERQMDTTGSRTDNHADERRVDDDRPHVDYGDRGCVVLDRVESNDDDSDVSDSTLHIHGPSGWSWLPLHNHASKCRWRRRCFDDDRVGVLHAPTSGDKPRDGESSAPVHGTHVDGRYRCQFVPRDVDAGIEHVHGSEHGRSVHIQWALSRDELHVHAPIVQQHVGLRRLDNVGVPIHAFGCSDQPDIVRSHWCFCRHGYDNHESRLVKRHRCDPILDRIVTERRDFATNHDDRKPVVVYIHWPCGRYTIHVHGLVRQLERHWRSDRDDDRTVHASTGPRDAERRRSHSNSKRCIHKPRSDYSRVVFNRCFLKHVLSI